MVTVYTAHETFYDADEGKASRDLMPIRKGVSSIKYWVLWSVNLVLFTVDPLSLSVDIVVWGVDLVLWSVDLALLM